MPDLVWRSVTELSRMIQTKEVSPVEVVRAFLERVAALGGKLKAFITVCADAPVAAARAAEAGLVAGPPAGPLHGVPYGPRISTTPGACGPRAAPRSSPTSSRRTTRRW